MTAAIPTTPRPMISVTSTTTSTIASTTTSSSQSNAQSISQSSSQSTTTTSSSASSSSGAGVGEMILPPTQARPTSSSSVVVPSNSSSIETTNSTTQEPTTLTETDTSPALNAGGQETVAESAFDSVLIGSIVGGVVGGLLLVGLLVGVLIWRSRKAAAAHGQSDRDSDGTIGAGARSTEMQSARVHYDDLPTPVASSDGGSAANDYAMLPTFSSNGESDYSDVRQQQAYGHGDLSIE